MVKHVGACIKLILVRQAFGSVWRHHDDGKRIKVILNDDFAICTDDRSLPVYDQPKQIGLSYPSFSPRFINTVFIILFYR